MLPESPGNPHPGTGEENILIGQPWSCGEAARGWVEASWLTAPHRMERSCFQREECRRATYIYLREWITTQFLHTSPSSVPFCNKGGKKKHFKSLKPPSTSSKDIDGFGKWSVWVEPKSKLSTTLLNVSLGHWWCNWLGNLQDVLVMLGAEQWRTEQLWENW